MNRDEPMAEQPIERTWQQDIDRQVDGELSDAQSRELLAMLDGIEGGWRRLALAYVEAQWLGRDLPSLVHGGAAPSIAQDVSEVSFVVPVPATNQPTSPRSRMALMALAIAASMLVAFVVSLRRPVSETTRKEDPAAPVAVQQPTGNADGQVVYHNTSAPLAAMGPKAVTPATKSEPEPGLVVIGSEDARDDLAATVPPRVIDALRRMGHRVDQRSGVMPVRLKDGRNVDVPYDQLEVQYRGASSYQ